MRRLALSLALALGCALPAFALNGTCALTSMPAFGEYTGGETFSVPMSEDGGVWRGTVSRTVNASHRAEILMVWQPADASRAGFNRFGRVTLALTVYGIKDGRIVEIKGKRIEDSDHLESLSFNEKSMYAGKPVVLTPENFEDVLADASLELSVRKISVDATASVDLLDVENAALRNPGMSLDALLAAGKLSQDTLRDVGIACGVDLR